MKAEPNVHCTKSPTGKEEQSRMKWREWGVVERCKGKVEMCKGMVEGQLHKLWLWQQKLLLAPPPPLPARHVACHRRFCKHTCTPAPLYTSPLPRCTFSCCTHPAFPLAAYTCSWLFPLFVLPVFSYIFFLLIFIRIHGCLLCVCVLMCMCVCVYIASHLSTLTASRCVSAIAAGVGVVCVLSFTCGSSRLQFQFHFEFLPSLPFTCACYLLPATSPGLLPTSWPALMKFAWVAASEQMPSSSSSSSSGGSALNRLDCVWRATAGGKEKGKGKGKGKGLHGFAFGRRLSVINVLRIMYNALRAPAHFLLNKCQKQLTFKSHYQASYRGSRRGEQGCEGCEAQAGLGQGEGKMGASILAFYFRCFLLLSAAKATLKCRR